MADPSRQVALDYSAMTHEEKESTDKQPFIADEVKHLIESLTADLKLAETGKQELFQQPHHVLFWLFAVRLGAETGLRLSDIAQLEWRSLAHMETGKVVLWIEKTNQLASELTLHQPQPAERYIGDLPVIDAKHVFPEQRALIKDPAKQRRPVRPVRPALRAVED